jgi:transposase-like protein
MADKRVGKNSRYKRKTTGKLPPKRKSTKGQKITEKQLEAVKIYFELNNSVTAVATRLGVPYGTVRDWFRKECVKVEIEKRMAELREKTGYSLEVSMAEAGEGMELARETKNANAFVKAIEHRAKLNGLLIEKLQHIGNAPFSINVVGLAPPAKDIGKIESTLVPPQLQAPSSLSDEEESLLEL